MKVEIKDGRISFNLYELFEGLEPEEKRLVVDTIACDEDVIRNVCEQVLTGWTEGCSHGYTRSCEEDPSTALDRARRTVALRAGEAAKKEIEDLILSLRWNKAIQDIYMKWAWTLKGVLDQHDIHAPICPPIPIGAHVPYEVVRKEKP